MSEHERGDRVLLRARVDGSGPSGSVVIVADRGTVHHVDPADLIPDDRHRTPIAPQDAHEGDVVRMEWEAEDGPHAREGAVYVSALGDLCVENTSVDIPSRTLYLLSRKPTERDKWWPPQPGDVAEWGGGQRWVCRNDAGNDDDWYWVRLGGAYGTATDADVPDDAVLVLPAQTREATS